MPHRLYFGIFTLTGQKNINVPKKIEKGLTKAEKKCKINNVEKTAVFLQIREKFWFRI